MPNKKYYMVLDTETVTDARIPYDIAWIIVDRAGNVHERFNALTAEVMNNPTLRQCVRKDSFSKRKASFYLDNEPAQIISFDTIAKTALQTLRYYENIIVVAYNAAFDVKVLNDYSQVLRGMPFFDPETKIWDLWNMALNVICDSRNYVKWCKENNHATDKGNISSSAESVYSYLASFGDFEEDHTALSDCEIEAEILQAVFNRKKKLHTDFCSPVMHRSVWKNRLKGVIPVEYCPCCGRPLPRK